MNKIETAMIDADIAHVMLNLPQFAALQPVSTVMLHLSCAVSDVSERADVTVRQKALLDAARKLLQMAGDEVGHA